MTGIIEKSGNSLADPIENMQDLEIQEHSHFSKVKKISSNLFPLMELSVWLIMGTFIFNCFMLARQLIQPLFSDTLYTPWVEASMLGEWQSHANLLNLLLSLSAIVGLWLSYLFLAQLRDVVRRLMSGDIFSQSNATNIFNAAKYFVILMFVILPLTTIMAYTREVSCSDVNLMGVILGSLFEFIFADLVLALMLFIIAHIISLAVKLDHEQKLTV